MDNGVDKQINANISRRHQKHTMTRFNLREKRLTNYKFITFSLFFVFNVHEFLI